LQIESFYTKSEHLSCDYSCLSVATSGAPLEVLCIYNLSIWSTGRHGNSGLAVYKTALLCSKPNGWALSSYKKAA